MKTGPVDTTDTDRLAPESGQALAKAREVFLEGNQLPERWSGRDDFTVLITRFGWGHHFLALWDAWRIDPGRSERLHVVALDSRPVTTTALAAAHAGTALPDLTAQLIAAWPPLTPNLHHLVFAQGHLRLTLAFGPQAQLLPTLRLQADALFLDDAFWPSDERSAHRALIKAAGRRSAAGATASSLSGAAQLHDDLATAGFRVTPRKSPHSGHTFTTAAFAPPSTAKNLPSLAVASTNAVVVGAGLAGAAVARALAERGLRVTVLEKADGVATGASGNPAGLFHGTFNSDDSAYARLYRTCALLATRSYRQAIAAGVPGQAEGLLRLAPLEAGAADAQALLRRVGIGPEYLSWLTAQEASARAGIALQHPCWFYPGGGWISPADWVRHALAHPRIRMQTGCALASLQRDGQHWRCIGPRGEAVASTGLLVLAHAEAADTLLRPLGHAGWPLEMSRGQISYWRTAQSSPLRLPIAGDGYAIPQPNGILCGATRQLNDLDASVRPEDHETNLERFTRLTGLPGPGGEAASPPVMEGRVGWRLGTDDRLPIAGAVALLGQAASTTQTRLLPREPGLFVLTALGARGLTLAPLMGDLVASQAAGTPWPLEQDLADAVDPGRWLVRNRRQAG